MNQNVEKLKRDNPEFSVQLFDDKDCREFIKTNFDTDVLNAYDTLVPGAYKADLWRYCVLYKNGGIYMDIKQSCVDGFTLMELTGDEQFVKDKIPDAYYNALMVAKQGSEYMKKCIDGIVINVKNRYYGINELDPTGPVFMYRVARENRITVNAPMQFTTDGKFITLFGRNIIHTEYPEYRMEQKLFQKTKHYADLWRQGSIYN